MNANVNSPHPAARAAQAAAERLGLLTGEGADADDFLPGGAIYAPVQGARPRNVPCRKAAPMPRTAADILREMAQTMDDRNAQYKDNWRMIAPMLRILFPDGVPSELVTQDFWHLFELLLVKIARFASTNCTHIDSIHDAGAYCGFVQLAIEETLKDSK